MYHWPNILQGYDLPAWHLCSACDHWCWMEKRSARCLEKVILQATCLCVAVCVSACTCNLSKLNLCSVHTYMCWACVCESVSSTCWCWEEGCFDPHIHSYWITAICTTGPVSHVSTVTWSLQKSPLTPTPLLRLPTNGTTCDFLFHLLLISIPSSFVAVCYESRCDQ